VNFVTLFSCENKKGDGVKPIKAAKTAFSVLKKETNKWQQRSQLTGLAESAGP
jgi:hypothetical protein